MNFKKLLKFFKRLYKFAVNNYFISVFLACIAFVGFISVYKMFFVKPVFIYAKIKMGQGMWWASTQKPSSWFIQSLKKESEEKDLTGAPLTKILSVRYYPWWGSNQYDVYLTMKLRVTGSHKTGRYNFKRSAIGVGSPVDFEFPSVQFSGTIIELSEKPIKDKLTEKIIYLAKPYAYNWEYDGIKINDKFFDGENTVVEIIDKSSGNTQSVIIQSQSVINPAFSQTRRDILVKVKILGKIINNQFVFAEEQPIGLGKTINLATENFIFNDYIVAGIE